MCTIPYWIANRTKLSKMWFSLAGLPINSLSQCRSNHQLPDVSNSSNFNLIIYLSCDYRGFGKRAGKKSLVFFSLKCSFTGLKRVIPNQYTLLLWLAQLLTAGAVDSFARTSQKISKIRVKKDTILLLTKILYTCRP